MKQAILTKQGGRVSVDTDLDALFSTLRNGVYTITVKRKQEQRSIAQNDLMWLWLTCIERETGTPKDDVYAYYCQKFLGRWISVGGLKQTRIYDTSSKLTKERMTEFLNNIQAEASSELGITLPSPDDLHWEAFFETYNR